LNPATHFLAGWLIANIDHLERRDRALVTLAGVIPDADGLGILAGAVSPDEGAGLALYGQYHHVLAHNIIFGVLLAVSVYAFSKKKTLTVLLALVSFHIHLLGDILSGRGPDGTIWTISYLFPFLRDFQFSWSGQWELNAWPNVARDHCRGLDLHALFCLETWLFTGESLFSECGQGRHRDPAAAVPIYAVDSGRWSIFLKWGRWAGKATVHRIQG